MKRQHVNEPKKLARRTFLRTSAILSAAAIAGCRSSGTHHKKEQPVTAGPGEEAQGLGSEMAEAPLEGGEKQFVRVLLSEANGDPLDKERARLLHARDMANDPLPVSIARADGRVRVGLPGDEPVQIVCRLKIPDFGEVYCSEPNFCLT